MYLGHDRVILPEIIALLSIDDVGRMVMSRRIDRFEWLLQRAAERVVEYSTVTGEAAITRRATSPILVSRCIASVELAPAKFGSSTRILNALSHLQRDSL